MKNEFRKISVITVTWNRADMLRQAIETVLAQNYPNFEHIIVDNDSNDNTLNILKSYPHLKWISEKDSGQSNAMNKGMKIADGEIFAWLNDDDLYPPGVFNLINKKFDESDCSFIYGVCEVVGEKGNRMGRSSYQHFDRQRLMLGYNNINTPAVFASMSLIKEVGCMDEDLFATFDLDMWIRLSGIKPPLAIKDVTSLLRLHNRSGLMSAKVHLKEFEKIRCKYKNEVSFIYRYLFDHYFRLRHFLYDKVKMKLYAAKMNQ